MAANTYYELGSRLVKRGSEGTDVQWVAERLNYFSSVPGVFDYNLESAVAAYQQRRGLGVDGKVGAQTWTALFADFPGPWAQGPIAHGAVPKLAGGSGAAPPGSGPNVTGSANAAGVGRIPAGTRLYIRAQAQNVFGGGAALVMSSALNRLGEAMARRGYANVTTQADWLGGGVVQMQGTPISDKAGVEGVRADVIGAGSEAGLPLGNVEVYTSAPNGGGNVGTYLLIGGAVLLIAFILD